MKRFRNLLVAIDLSHADRLVSPDLTPPNRKAVEQGIWLARINRARITFLTVLDLWEHTRHLIEEDTAEHETVVTTADRVLRGLVAEAALHGVESGRHVVQGRSGQEILREVQRGRHDLVICGSRRHSTLHQMTIGSTGQTLLRCCPCPVWITVPEARTEPSRILVATDLSPACLEALRLGVTIAQLSNGELHILHALETSAERPLQFSGAGLQESAVSHDHPRSELEEILETHCHSAEVDQLPIPPRFHFPVGAAEECILEAIAREKIDLVVMVTAARTGWRGFFVGNAVERLIPRVPCSVLAIKPAGFEYAVDCE